MPISAKKLYEFLNQTTFLYNSNILTLLDRILETGITKVKWGGRIYDLSADKSESENKE